MTFEPKSREVGGEYNSVAVGVASGFGEQGDVAMTIF